MFENIVKLIDVLAWPTVTLVSLFMLHQELCTLVESIASRATKLTAGKAQNGVRSCNHAFIDK